MKAVEWPPLPKTQFVRGRLATEEDVNAGRAVFYLKGNAQPADLLIPQYAYFSDDAGQEPEPSILIQAEETIDGCMVGLRRLDGSLVLGILRDVRLLGQTPPQA